MNRIRTVLVLIAGGLVCLATGGCGSGGGETVQAKGRVTDAGKPLEVQGRDVGIGVVRIEFYRIGEDGKQATEPETAVADEDGYFDLPGRDGHGIPPGKYRIAVRQWDPLPDVDRLGGRFDAQHSPIIREVTGREDIVIDVSKPEG